MLRHRLHCHIERAQQACARRTPAAAAAAPPDAGRDGVPELLMPAPSTSTSAAASAPPGREWVVLNEVTIDR